MYNFDEVIDRKNTNAMNIEGFRDYIFHADASMKFPYKDDEFVRMWVADMEFATPECVINGMRKRLDRRIFGYTRVFDPKYFEAFSSWCKRRYDWTFDKEELVMSNGIIPALYELVDYITKPDEKVIFLTPSYAYFKYAADFHDRECVCSNLIDNDGYYTIDYQDLDKKCADPKTTLFILCNPHNPTGRVWKKEELEKLGEIIEKHQMWVISDEIHCDLRRTGMVHIPLGKVMPDYDRLITCMIAVMIVTMILVGIVGGMSADQLGNSFAKGLASMAFVAFVIGMAKVISLILTNGNVIHTIVYVLTQPLMGLPKSFSSVGLTLIVSLINPIIPSATSKAAILVPIMKPVAEALGLQPNLTVVAYQMGDSFTNLISPLLGWMIGSCAMANVPYSKWLKWVFPKVMLFILLACIIIFILTTSGWTGVI